MLDELGRLGLGLLGYLLIKVRRVGFVSAHFLLGDLLGLGNLGSGVHQGVAVNRLGSQGRLVEGVGVC